MARRKGPATALAIKVGRTARRVACPRRAQDLRGSRFSKMTMFHDDNPLLLKPLRSYERDYEKKEKPPGLHLKSPSAPDPHAENGEKCTGVNVND